ncbi:MAG: L-lactate dehydrogenase [Tissierellia bacterium]|nr:L-lactate dehydrogenase [Tissierellia bacterium]
MKNRKVIIIGDGAVGSSYAFSMAKESIAREIGIIDIDENKAKGDAMDLTDVIAFNDPKDIYKANYNDCKDADLVVITAGASQKEGETRLDLVEKNLKIFKPMIKQIVDSGFNGIFLIASNPVDILTYATWKYSNFPTYKIIGSGTTLDSSRFRMELSNLLNVDARNVHAYILGEHGDSEFPVWSHANVGGLHLYEWVNQFGNDVDEKALLDTVEIVKNKAYEIIKLKKATFYGIAASLTKISKAILNNEEAILPVSTYLNGEYDLEDIFISSPAIIGNNGINSVIELPLNDNEMERMKQSYKILNDTIRKFF